MNSSQKNLLIELYKLPQTVFTLGEVAMITNASDVALLAQRLNYNVRKGRLLNPRKGIYAKPGYNPEELACLLYTPSYLSLEYVLQRAGVIFQYYSELTAVSYLSREVQIDGNTLKYRRLKGELLAATDGIIRKGNLNIATPERAFLDVMYLNSEYYFDNLRPLDVRKVKQLLHIYDIRKMEQRVMILFNNQ
ncbi:type IV toxin-antitoxin system AbiEi family antitoxin domain-containing protein [Bacteroides sp.]|uniref:type IV toxin-antitoxin system AbiEi family antitoxin domain-containing protein n=1 Tax=Bacteroides sp. TaxID=29523 RepID=UPI0025C11903|nr:hypothetical protein [Bacteroides sp.]